MTGGIEPYIDGIFSACCNTITREGYFVGMEESRVRSVELITQNADRAGLWGVNDVQYCIK